jgi:uncharacterized hydrophobic protein (TIGR00271 family)
MKRFIITILQYFNLDTELENPDVVHQEILKGIVFKGTNLWILVFAIIVASVGLNMNSTAVIIGAMLISPLMGPINGMGYSVATYDFELFRKSIKNFTFAVLTSLVTSTVYFAISPISTAHSELLARTSPTIYDVLIAFFGGLAGIVATGSKLKGNVIPGVAIATALMPPLCTAGYGLATAQFDFFFGAFYLFTINTVFIALASVAVSQILKFPIRSIIDNNEKVRVNRYLSLIISAVLLPSIYFGYLLVQEEKFRENAISYTNSVSIVNGNFLLSKEINPKKKQIELVYGGTKLTKKEEQEVKERAKSFKLENPKILIKQGLNFDVSSGLTPENIRLKDQIVKLKKQLEESKKKATLGNELLEEIKTIYPQIYACYFTEIVSKKDTTTFFSPVVIMMQKGEQKLSDEQKDKVTKWTKSRLKSQEVQIVFP